MYQLNRLMRGKARSFAPIIGALNLEQLKESLASVDVKMTPELRAEIADLSRTPAPATDRSEELKAVKAA